MKVTQPETQGFDEDFFDRLFPRYLSPVGLFILCDEIDCEADFHGAVGLLFPA